MPVRSPVASRASTATAGAAVSCPGLCKHRHLFPASLQQGDAAGDDGLAAAQQLPAWLARSTAGAQQHGRAPSSVTTCERARVLHGHARTGAASKPPCPSSANTSGSRRVKSMVNSRAATDEYHRDVLLQSILQTTATGSMWIWRRLEPADATAAMRKSEGAEGIPLRPLRNLNRPDSKRGRGLAHFTSA
jgi:hypothetical protein